MAAFLALLFLFLIGIEVWVESLLDSQIVGNSHFSNDFFSQSLGVLGLVVQEEVSVLLQASHLEVLPVSSELVDSFEDETLLLCGELTVLAQQVDANDELPVLVVKLWLLDFIPLFGLWLKILAISLGSIDFGLLVIVPGLLFSVKSVLLLFVDSPLLE